MDMRRFRSGPLTLSMLGERPRSYNALPSPLLSMLSSTSAGPATPLSPHMVSALQSQLEGWQRTLERSPSANSSNALPSPLLSMLSPTSAGPSTPLSPRMVSALQSHLDGWQRTPERSPSAQSVASFTGRRSPGYAAEMAERLVGLGVLAPENTESALASLPGGGCDSIYTVPSPSSLDPIMEAGFETAHQSPQTPQTPRTPQSAPPHQQQQHQQQRQDNGSSPSRPRKKTSPPRVDRLRGTASAQSILNATSDTESLREDRSDGEPRGGSGTPDENGVSKPSPRSFRRKELQLSRSLSSSLLQDASSDQQLRSLVSSSSATSFEKTGTAGTPASAYGPGSGVYWYKFNSRGGSGHGHRHRPQTSSTSGASVLSLPSTALDNPDGSGETEFDEMNQETAAAARSGSTFELVQWQVATESATHLEDIFLPLGANGDDDDAGKRAPASLFLPDTPLKRPASPMGLNEDERQRASHSLMTPLPEDPTRRLSGLGISAAADGEDVESKTLRGMPGYGVADPFPTVPASPQRESFDVEMQRSAALERVLEQLEGGFDGGASVDPPALECSPSSVRAAEPDRTAGVGTGSSMIRSVDTASAAKTSLCRGDPSSAARDGSTRPRPVVHQQRSSSLRHSSTIRRNSQQQEPRMSLPSLDVFSREWQEIREPLTGLMDHRQSVASSLQPQSRPRPPKIERDAGADPGGAGARAAIAISTATEVGADAEVSATRYLERRWVLVTLLVLTLAWQALFFVFPASYLWNAIQPVLVAVAAVLFSLVDVTLFLVLLSTLSRSRQKRGDPLASGVEAIWVISTAVAVAYAVALCAVQLVDMTRSSDGGAAPGGIHLDRTRTTGGDRFREVLRDVPIAAVLFLTGCMALLLLLVSTAVRGLSCCKTVRRKRRKGGTTASAAAQQLPQA